MKLNGEPETVVPHKEKDKKKKIRRKIITISI